MVKNIIFDIGNVLVEFGYKAYFEKFNLGDEMVKRIIKSTVGNTAWNELDRGVFSEEDVLNEFIKADPEIEKELRLIYADFQGLLIQFDYTKDWIKDLKEAGYKVYCLSNMSTKALRECKEVFDFVPLLDGYVYSCDVKMCKPDRDIYEFTLEKFGIKAEESVFIDDTAANVKAAEAVGIKGIVFTGKDDAMERIAAMQ